MPDHPPFPSAARLDRFPPPVLRQPLADRRLRDRLETGLHQAHPDWPWPLVEAEARRLARSLLSGRDGNVLRSLVGTR